MVAEEEVAVVEAEAGAEEEVVEEGENLHAQDAVVIATILAVEAAAAAAAAQGAKYHRISSSSA